MGPRYSMLETIRAYAADELAKSGQTYQLHTAHAEYFLNLAETLSPLFYGYDQVRAFAVLDAELNNMRAAGRFFQSDVSYAERNLRLMAALWDFYCCRCHLAEGIRYARGALAQGEQAGLTEPTVLLARVQLGLGALLELHGDAENSEFALNDAVRTARASGDLATEAYALRILAMNAWLRGDPDGDAGDLTMRAQAAADASGSLWHQAYAAQTVATVRGGTPEGAEMMADVWRLTGETGDRRLLSYLRVITAFHALGGPRRAEAIGMLTDAYQDFHMVGDRYGRLLALSTRLIAQVAWEGDPEVTARLIGRCESAYAGMGTGPLTVIEMGIDAATTVTRDALGEHRYALAVAEGAKLSWDRLAVALVEDLRNGLAGGEDIPSALDPVAVLESSGTTWRMAANGGFAEVAADGARRRRRPTPVFGAVPDEMATSSVLSVVRTAVSATDAIMIKRSGPTPENARGQHNEPAASKLGADGSREGGRRRTNPPPAEGDGVLDLLTRREQEIAGHVAQGLTNRRIAEDLVISERTVDTHVQHILAKLGVANRVQLATLLASRSE
jgi:DNA-binding CsgD family transcriptional regulator